MLSVPADLLFPFSAFDFSHSPVVVAVSGGGDSTALLILLRHFLNDRFPATDLIAATVDHGLRAGSDAEACAVAALCARLGTPHRILQWQDPKPETGLPAAARLARYRLLAGLAREVGAETMVTGHTADDQAETVAMRRVRGPGPGLAGMAPATLFDGSVWIARPLLGIRRTALRQFLASRDIGWAEDPTNTDARHERARVRMGLQRGADAPGKTESLLAVARQAAIERERLATGAASLIAEHASRPAPGLIRLAPEFLLQSPGPDALHALRILLAVVGGRAHLADEAGTRALLSRLADPPHRATLSRAMIVSRRDGLWLCRERRGLPPAEGAVEGMIWDGRYRLERREGPVDVIVQAAGEHIGFPPLALDPSLPASLSRTARFCQPMFHAIATSGTTCAAPHPYPLPVKDGEREAATSATPSPRPSRGEGKGEGRHNHRNFDDEVTRQGDNFGWRVIPVLAPWATFLPSFDLAVATAVARLIGAVEPATPPFAQHIVTSA